MDATYPTTYRDRHGTVETTIHNDGKMLSMTVRGVTFCGTDFDALEPESASNHDDLKSFTLQRNELCSCVIVTDMPMPVVRNGVTEEAQLRVLLELGDPAPNGGIDRELLSLQLQFGEGSVETTKGHSHFEDALLEIQQQLPDATYMLRSFRTSASRYLGISRRVDHHAR